uniref:Uncharacterized protein n=1 Tax=Arundo donax TaxID=35708 RepID=A0A0A8Z038_ARUDO
MPPCKVPLVLLASIFSPVHLMYSKFILVLIFSF